MDDGSSDGRMVGRMGRHDRSENATMASVPVALLSGLDRRCPGLSGTAAGIGWPHRGSSPAFCCAFKKKDLWPFAACVARPRPHPHPIADQPPGRRCSSWRSGRWELPMDRIDRRQPSRRIMVWRKRRSSSASVWVEAGIRHQRFIMFFFSFSVPDDGQASWIMMSPCHCVGTWLPRFVFSWAVVKTCWQHHQP